MTEKSPYYNLRQAIMSMTEQELRAQRTKSTSITNILDKDFDFKWDSVDYCIEKSETQSHPFYLAEHAAFHMARTYCTEKGIEFHKKGWEIVDKIMGKEFIEYNKLTKKQAIELAKKRKISLEDNKGKEKSKEVLIADLKATH